MKERLKETWFDLKEHFKQREYNWKFKLYICFPIFIALLIIDIITKQLAIHYLTLNGETVKFMDGFINFQLTINYGIAFGANADNLTATIIGAVLITLVTCLFFLYFNQKIALVGLVMVITGGFGNLVDRMWNNGGVVDFLSWELFAPKSIFNCSDMWVTFGVVVIIFAILFELIRYFINQNHHGDDDGTK